MSRIEIDLDAITSEMAELKDAKARYQFELKQVEKEIEKRELQLIALLNQTQVDEMKYGVYNFYLKTVKRKSFDQKLFKEKYPDLFQEFYLEKESERFEFKIGV